MSCDDDSSVDVVGSKNQFFFPSAIYVLGFPTAFMSSTQRQQTRPVEYPIQGGHSVSDTVQVALAGFPSIKVIEPPKGVWLTR